MIAYLEGNIKIKQPNYLVVVVQNVGYKVFAPAQIIEPAKLNTDITLYTYQYLRENIVELYGFLQLAELELFERLLTVSGVGPKAGLAILSLGSANMIKQAIVSHDSATLTAAAGIGKKTAERLILELKDKLVLDITGADSVVLSNPSGSDVSAALESLGYSVNEARRVMQHIDPVLPLAQQVKAALQLLSKTSHKTI